MSTHPPAGPAQARELPPLSPMLAVIGPLPPPETEGEFAYETLWNGARTLVRLPPDGTVQVVSATGLDATGQYPELQALAGLLPAPEAVLDGEIVVLDEQGRPSVERLQQRMSLHHPAAVDHARQDLPAWLVIYDVLYLGEPVIQLPYTARRDLLDDLGLAGPGIIVPAAWPSMANEALENSRERVSTGSSPSDSPAHTFPGGAPATGSRSSTWPRPDDSGPRRCQTWAVWIMP
ncbi:ATP-dependent DNA ligase [Streptomyces sp. NPDC004227]